MEAQKFNFEDILEVFLEKPIATNAGDSVNNENNNSSLNVESGGKASDNLEDEFKS